MGQLNHGKGSAYRPHAGIQAQFAHNEVLLQLGHVPLPRSGNHAQGYGDVVAAALLVHIGGCQIDDNFLSRHVEAPGLQGRHRPKEAFLDGGVGQSDQMQAYAQRYFYLHGDRNCLNANTFGAMNGNQHTYSSLTEVK